MAALGPAESKQARDLTLSLKQQGIGLFLISYIIYDVFDLEYCSFVMNSKKLVGSAQVGNVTQRAPTRQRLPWPLPRIKIRLLTIHGRFVHICGTDRLGTAQVIRWKGWYEAVECEGGHAHFAPLDEIDDFLPQRQRQLYRSVPVERIVSGPGLEVIYEALAALAHRYQHVVEHRYKW